MFLMTMTESAVQSSMVALPLMSKGLLTTALGLLGVFLVLGLLFATIKLLQRIGVKKDEK